MISAHLTRKREDCRLGREFSVLDLVLPAAEQLYNFCQHLGQQKNLKTERQKTVARLMIMIVIMMRTDLAGLSQAHFIPQNAPLLILQALCQPFHSIQLVGSKLNACWNRALAYHAS